MRLIKAQTTNLRNIYGKGVRYDIDDQVIMDSTNTVLIPKGTTAQRPSSPINGHMRYNTDDDRFEIYEQLAWYGVRLAAPSSSAPIHQQNLGNGDGVITLFGPLDSQDTNPLYTAPAAAVNVLVLVENVFQISTTNYTLVQNPSSTLTGQEVITTNIQAGTEYIITDPGDSDFTTIGAANNLQGTVFTATGSTTGTGLVRPTGYYLEFTSAPDLAKPVTVLHNFDK